MRTKEGQEKHDRAVAAQASWFVNNGWPVVYADLPNLAKPPQIGGFRLWAYITFLKHIQQSYPNPEHYWCKSD